MPDVASIFSWSTGAGGAGPCNCRSCCSRLTYRLCPLLKLGILRLHVVLKVDDPVGMSIHLLMSDVKQNTGVVSPMLGLTKSMVSDLQLMILL
jgi:hypothetical protein